MRQIDTGIPQGSPISPILFLIYIRFLFPKIRMAIPGSEAYSPSFIDDVAIYVESRTIAQNVKVLEKLIEVAFEWADQNAVQFDDSKSELIHFHKSCKASTTTVALPNGTVLHPKEVVRWLGIWLDWKLNFKCHVQKRIMAATSAMYSVLRLMNSEWGLSAHAGRQLYLACVTAISDYGSEIW